MAVFWSVVVVRNRNGYRDGDPRSITSPSALSGAVTDYKKYCKWMKESPITSIKPYYYKGIISISDSRGRLS